MSRRLQILHLAADDPGSVEEQQDLPILVAMMRHLEDLEDLDLDPALLETLSHQAGHGRLPPLELATRELPETGEV